MAGIDPNSATWRELVRHIDERIETLRVRLEYQGLPTDETEGIRGAIAELREIRDLGEAKTDVGLTEAPVLIDS